MYRKTTQAALLLITVSIMVAIVSLVVAPNSVQADDGNVLSIEDKTVLPNQQTTVAVLLAQTEGTVYGFDLTITYDPSVATFVDSANGNEISGWTSAVNDTTPGTLLIGLAGGSGMTAGGEILVLTFQGAASADSTSLSLARGELNEGAIAASLVDGSITVNTPPVAYGDNYEVDEDEVLTVAADGVLTNDGDMDGHSLTAAKLTDPSHGSVTLNSDGSLSYTPDTDYYGPDSFTYSATDLYGASDTATVNITVNAVNDAPVADAGGPYTVNEGGNTSLDGRGSTDVDDTTGLIYEWDIDGNDTYETTGFDPTFDASALDGPSQVTVKLRVRDTGGATSSPDSATVTVQNVAPTADAGGPYSVVQGETIQLDGSGSSDPAGEEDPLTYAWDLDDNGTFESSGVSPSFNSSGFAIGPATVSLKVSDDDGGKSTMATATVNVVARTHDVAGIVTFWFDGSAVSDVELDLSGASTSSATSESDGTFELLDIPEGNCTLIPSKTDELAGITAYDASLVLQHMTEVVTLSGAAATAADVNQGSGISAGDASTILRRAVELDVWPYEDDLPAWVFSPGDRSYSPLAADMTDQDFEAVLMGDVSGSWTSAVSAAEAAAAVSVNSSDVLHKSVDPETGEIHIVMRLPENALSQSAVSFEATILYSSESAELVTVNALVTGWMMAANTDTPGVVKVALAGAEAIDAGNPVVELVLSGVSEDSGTETVLLEMTVNESVLLNGSVLRLPYLMQ